MQKKKNVQGSSVRTIQPLFGESLGSVRAATAALTVLFGVATPALAASPAPVAEYDFGAGSGGTLTDQSGNNHSGTLVNGPTWTSGKYGGGLAFDGVDDFVDIGDVAQAEGLTSITVSTWVKFAVSGGGAYETHFVDKSTCDGTPGAGPWELGVSLTSAHKAEFVIYPQDGRPYIYLFSGASQTSIDDGAWHYVTGRYDGANLSIWVDGSLENSRAYAGLTMMSNSYGIDMGGHCNGYSTYPFQGTLDDVRIYDRALSSSEVQGDMSTPVGNGASSPPDTTAPTVPTGLSASGVTSTQATLSWQASTDSTGVAGYHVYRDGLLAGTTATTSFTQSGLAANTNYVFTVDAFDAAANTSQQSAPRSLTTAAGPAPTAGYVTSFYGTENPLSEGGVWVNGKAVGVDWNNVQSMPGKAYASVLSGNPNRYNDSIAHLNTTFTAEQFAQGTVYRQAGYSPGASKHEVELLLRFQISARNARGYEVMWGHSGYLSIVRWNGPLADYTVLYESGDPGIGQAVDGDVLRATINGSLIRVYKNGALVATVSDATWADGQPGMGFWPVDGASIEKYGWKTYEAGNL